MKKLILSTVLLCAAQIAALNLKLAITLKSLHPDNTTEYSSTLGALKLLEPHMLKIYENATEEDLAAPIRVPYTDPALKMLLPIYNALTKHPELGEEEIVQVLATANANPGIDFKADQTDEKKLSGKQVETLRLFFGDMSELPGNAGNTVANAVGRYLREKDLRPLPTTQVLELFKTGKDTYMPFAQQLYISIAQFITDTDTNRLAPPDQSIETLIGMPYLPNIIQLMVYNNKLMSLQGLQQSLPKLESLNLEGNQLRDLTNMPTELPELKWLSLKKNQIKTLKGLPTRIPKLEELHLENNQLKDLTDMPTELPKLDELFLMSNQIETLKGMPKELPKLTILYLSDNQLVSLRYMPEAPKLWQLFLTKNNLSDLYGISSESPSLVYVYVENNPRITASNESVRALRMKNVIVELSRN